MLTPLTFVGDERALLQALRAGHPGAAAAFYDQHAAHVSRTLRSALGADEEIPDLLQEVFIRAIDGIGKLREVDRGPAEAFLVAPQRRFRHLCRRRGGPKRRALQEGRSNC